MLRHMVAVIVITQWFFYLQVSQGDGRDNSGNHETLQHPKRRHAANPNFKVAYICF